ncbi:hypothetical protein Bpfe_012045 [Biomphalaria pfeifferi]|uniref:Uncharacterized protein n=1 Tax=Biomphalaria pfeifferi TaxID=112525 RepID=A0AAD8BQK2_BIOPF|nr:hypothetical protein Bpfe_012045 [Biomphalaria pfeifferi]
MESMSFCRILMPLETPKSHIREPNSSQFDPTISSAPRTDPEVRPEKLQLTLDNWETNAISERLWSGKNCCANDGGPSVLHRPRPCYIE